jgi:hypothetical protein
VKDNILIQEVLAKALKEKDVKLEDMEEDRFCIADNIINNDIMWEKLENVYCKGSEGSRKSGVASKYERNNLKAL